MENNHRSENQSPKAYIYDVAANGMEVRIPADQYESWKAAQDRIRRGQENTIGSDTAKRLAELMKQKEEEGNQLKRQAEDTISKDTLNKECAKKEKNSKAKSVLTSIPLSIMGLMEFYLIYGIAFLIIALLFWLISYIPILSTLIDWLFCIREDTPDMFAMFVSTVIAYLGFTVTIEHISKKVETKKLTLMFVGICLIVLNVLFLIINLKYNNAILTNVLLGIAGIVIFFKGKRI